MAVLNGGQTELNVGDILYNFEHQIHYFYTDPATNDDFVFVEFLIPVHCQSARAPNAITWAWLQPSQDTDGNKKLRDIAYHVHGNGGNANL